MLATSSDPLSTRKKDVVARALPDEVIYQVWKGRYYTTCDYSMLLNILKRERHPKIHEYVRRNQPVNLFFDIDFNHNMLIVDTVETQTEHEETGTSHAETSITRENVLDVLHARLLPFLENADTHRRVILHSHKSDKTSYHVIYKLYMYGNLPVMISNKMWIRKNVFDAYNLAGLRDVSGKSIIDPMVYNDGTLRTYLSCKSTKPYRPFRFDQRSQHESELESFIGYSFPSGYDATVGRAIDAPLSTFPESTTTLPPEQDYAIREFVHQKFGVPLSNFRSTTRIGTGIPQVYIADFKHEPCMIADRTHKSNTQYVVLGPKKATYKCRDVADCTQKKEDRLIVTYADYTDALKAMLIKPGPDVKGEMKAVIRARTNDSPPGSPVYDIEHGEISYAETAQSTYYDEKDPGVHIMTPSHYRLRRNSSCVEFYESMTSAPSVVQHITINQHFYGVIEDAPYRIKIPSGVFDNQAMTERWEDAINLTGEDTLAEIFCIDEDNVVYSNGSFYIFTGTIWKVDTEGLILSRAIKQKLVPMLTTIIEAFDVGDKAHNAIIKTRKLLDSNKGLSNILSRTKNTLHREDFATKLGTNLRLVPFENGVYEIEHCRFRPYSRHDMFTTTVGYSYDPEVRNLEVMNMLSSIFPDEGIRQFFVNSVANALDGAIPNTRFIMMVGETASNGKTCIMNLMQKTFGFLSEVINPTILIRKEGDPASASPHLAKLINVRLVCLSEPEKGELNTSSLKRLFGGESVNARFLHHNEISFKVIAKAFIACNKPPKIDSSDEGAWRRIVCIPFTSRFVSSPTKPNEFPVDIMLSHKIDTDPSMRQTFMNILIGFLGKDSPMPIAVALRTTQVRECNDQFTKWMHESIVQEADALLTLQSIVQAYKGEIVTGTKVLSKYKERVDSFLDEKFNIPQSNYMSRSTSDRSRKRCWKGVKLVQ